MNFAGCRLLQLYTTLDRLQKKVKFYGFFTVTEIRGKNSQFHDNFLGIFCWKVFDFALILTDLIEISKALFIVFRSRSSGRVLPHKKEGSAQHYF